MGLWSTGNREKRKWPKCIWKDEFAAKGYLLRNEANKSFGINKNLAWGCKKGYPMQLNQLSYW